jgi:biotin operon repressor
MQTQQSLSTTEISDDNATGMGGSQASASRENQAGEAVYGLVSEVLTQVREELDDHREAINENTSEIGLGHEMVAELAKRIDVLTARIDELTLLVKGKGQTAQRFEIKPLSEREKQVFHVLYSLSEQRNNAVSYDELAFTLKTSESSIAGFVAAFIAKGIPVVKRYASGKAYVGLDECFRQAQAKDNIVGINTLLTYWQGKQE